MTFSYNPNSTADRESQWTSYLGGKQKEFVSDIRDVVEQQTRDYHQTLKTVSSQQAAAMQHSAEMISGGFENGLKQLSTTFETSLDEVSIIISELGGMLDWRLDMMIEGQQISNLLSENIARLLRIPDFQKERRYYIEQGFKHYLNAAKDEDLFRDALKNFLKAEALEETDYIVLHRIGLIYLHFKALRAVPKAEAYMRKAAKYAVAETDPKAKRIANILAGDPRKKLSEQEKTPDWISWFASKCYLLAGRACYIQGKLSESVELAEKAFTLNPQLLDAGFDQAKALAAWGKEELDANEQPGKIGNNGKYRYHCRKSYQAHRNP